MESTFEQAEQPKRPTFLTVLCILTFIYIGMTLISTPISLVVGAPNEEQIDLTKAELLDKAIEMRETGFPGLGDIMEQLAQMSASLSHNFYAALGVTTLFSLLGLFGAIFMWKGRKLGFHFYIIYNIMATAYVYLFVNPSYIPTFFIVYNLLISGLFIFLYSRNLKWMK